MGQGGVIIDLPSKVDFHPHSTIAPCSDEEAKGGSVAKKPKQSRNHKKPAIDLVSESDDEVLVKRMTKGKAGGATLGEKKGRAKPVATSDDESGGSEGMKTTMKPSPRKKAKMKAIEEEEEDDDDEEESDDEEEVEDEDLSYDVDQSD